MLKPKLIMQRINARLSRQGNLGQALIKGVIGNVGIKLANNALGLVNTMLLAKILAPAGYGIYAYVMAMVSLLVIPSELGIPTLATREIAVANARKDWGHMRGFIMRAHQAIGIITVVLVVLGLTILFVWGKQIDPVKLKGMALGLLLVPMVSLGALRGAMLRGLRKVIIGFLPEQIIRPLMFLVFNLLLLRSKDLVSAATIMGSQILATIISFCCGLYLFLRNRPPELRGAVPRFKTAVWLKSSIPFGMSAALSLINGRTDILVLGIFRADADVGIYRVAAQIAMLVIFGLQAVNSIQGPHIAHLFAMGDMQRLQKMVTRSSQAILLVTLPTVLVIILFGEIIIRAAFGAEYEAAYVPLVILCVGQLVNAAMGSVASLLNMTGHERDTTVSIFIAVIVNVVLNFSLVPSWGMKGSAVATAATLIVWNLLMCRKVYLRTGIQPSALFRRQR